MTPNLSKQCEIGVAESCESCLDELLNETKKLTTDQICCNYVIPDLDLISPYMVRIQHGDSIYYLRPVVEGEKVLFEVYCSWEALGNAKV